jgi:hypothetical protein
LAGIRTVPPTSAQRVAVLAASTVVLPSAVVLVPPAPKNVTVIWPSSGGKPVPERTRPPNTRSSVELSIADALAPLVSRSTVCVT